jgi:ubiquinone/menaquinone biosynthesis C-methylase UbiE
MGCVQKQIVRGERNKQVHFTKEGKMDSNKERTKEYFDKNPDHFKNATDEYPIMYQEAAKKIDPHIKGTVLDIGSGGVINYNFSNADELILADITTANQDKIKERNGKEQKTQVTFINADVTKLAIKQESTDLVIMQHLLHHLADNNLKKTLNNLTKTAQNTHNVLKKGGELIIVEGTVPPFFDKLQRALFPISKRVYKHLFNFPMVLQYSKEKITKELKMAGFSIESCEIIKDGDELPIFGLRLPRKYIPIRHHVIIARK